ncbi:MAG TPA: YgjV family protein [Steroidobacteraceae bacterium]|nr:YgjV family protein [Steroidobacteraceae bacterium]
MSSYWIQCLGWAATCVFVASYFFAKPSRLRAIQMLGALLWITYGVLIGALPVIIANLLVFAAAAWTALRKSSRVGSSSAAA